MTDMRKQTEAQREAQQPAPATELREQEPVAQEWRYYFSHSGATGKPDEVVGPCFTDRKEVAFGVGCFDQTALCPPAQRKLLTDEEILVSNYPDGEENGPTIAAPDFELICFARQIEAKLQEKNGITKEQT